MVSPAPPGAVLISIAGDLTGFVTGDPPLDATGTATADVTIDPEFTLFGTSWSISTAAGSGTATIDAATGAWTYTVDPAFFATLDNGEIAIDTFQITHTVQVQGDTFFPIFEETETATVTITIEGVCFVAGTAISTPNGDRPVEAIRTGDPVTTLDRGARPVRWVESAEVSVDRMTDEPALRPVRIRAGALSAGQPARDLWVSQEHRLLVSGPAVDLLFGEAEALVAAKFLCQRPGIDVILPDRPVCYVHLLLDRHEILTADGAAAESLYLGNDALARMGSDALTELAAIFPDRPQLGPVQFGVAARRILSGFEAEALYSQGAG